MYITIIIIDTIPNTSNNRGRTNCLLLTIIVFSKASKAPLTSPIANKIPVYPTETNILDKKDAIKSTIGTKHNIGETLREAICGNKESNTVV